MSPLLTWRLAHFASAAAWLHSGLGPVHGVARVPGAAAGKAPLLTWASSSTHGTHTLPGPPLGYTRDRGPCMALPVCPGMYGMPTCGVSTARVSRLLFGRLSRLLPHTSPSWQAVADEIRASSSDVIVEIVPCDLGRVHKRVHIACVKLERVYRANCHTCVAQRSFN